MQSSENKPPLRVISMAWGEAFVQQFLEISLPAVISPDNLPALTEYFSVTLVFVTETRLFDLVRAHRAYSDVEKICAIKLIGLDDLVATKDAYGISITYALYRGFEDLGADMTDCYQLFLNSDFVLANGSYRGLLPYLLKGDRLILAPSYCANSEEVLPQILAAKNVKRGDMPIAKRKLADLILRNRHLTIRTKTINQRFYSANIIDQFYFAVDESTLLGYQLPVAVVAMKPEQCPLEINSYWDYGLIAEFCPSLNFTVIGDSDVFLMLELRERDRARSEVRLGWPTTVEIAYGLRNVATGYTVAAGGKQLILHSKDVEKTLIESGRLELSNFFEDVILHLHPIANHLDHLQWVIHHSRFHKVRKEFLENAERYRSKAINELPYAQEPHRGVELEALTKPAGEVSCKPEKRPRTSTGVITSEFLAAAPYIIPEEQVVANFLMSHLGGADVFLQVGTIRNLIQEEFQRFRKLIGDSDSTKRAELSSNKISEIGHSVVQFELATATLANLIAKMLAFESGWYRQEFNTLQSALREAPSAQQRISTNDAPKLLELPAKPKRVGRLIWDSIFGLAPNFKPSHSLYSPTRAARSMAIAAIANSNSILNIRGPSAIDLGLIGGCTKSVTMVDIKDLANLSDFINGHLFDICIVETGIDDLFRLSQVYEHIRPHLSLGGKMILLFLSPTAEHFVLKRNYLADNLLPPCGPMEIYVAGNFFEVLSLRIKAIANRLFPFPRSHRLFELAAHAFGTVIAAPFSLLGSLLTQMNQTMRRDFSKRIASVTIGIRIG